MDARLVFLGSLHIVIGAASLTLTVVTTSVIFTNKDLFKWISYKIMFQLNLCYLFHITAHIGVLGALLDIGWFGILFFNFLLSLERLNVTICKTYVKINKVAFVKKTAYSDSQSQQERGNVEQCILMPSTLMFSYALAAKAVFFILRRTSFWINFASLIVWMSEPLFCQVVQVVFNRYDAD
ncbi:hypothetical protein L596_016871 [Steinernema carpocapsae]|uniref:Uncharacterized protein n=1 Tax=Steinernema carpocapsae TaxID=34508 RepID=A0A4U5NJC0_STECR|nr:hypothetical protein L596_016871 [Steinernema carpocapsae]